MHSPASLAKNDAWWSESKRGALLGGALRLVLAFEPAAQAVFWGAVVGGILYLNWGERRTRRLLYIGAWLCAAIATMAKGPAGFGLPMICAFAYVATKKRWGEILRFELVTGFLVILAVALPWYVAMYVRHGSPFTDRLIFHDMFNRAFSHVHDTNEGDDTGLRYYIWQFGYASFPWSGLVPLGLLWGFRRSDSAVASETPTEAKQTFETNELGEVVVAKKKPAVAVAAVGDTSVLLVMWCLFAFALFTFMGTKFHHYIFPAIPPAAMLVGIALDDMLGRAALTQPKKLASYLALIAIGVGVTVFGASKLWPGSVFGIKPDAAATGSVGASVAIAAIGIAIVAAAILLFRGRAAADERPATESPKPASSSPAEGHPYRSDEPAPVEDGYERGKQRAHEELLLGGAGVAAALVTMLVGRDLAVKAEGGETAGAIRLLQLFTYNYRRPWPETLDFSAVLGGFTLVAGVVGLTLAFRSIRRHAVAAACAFAVVWAVWGLDVYMMATSPHWGQHELIEAYYRDRKSPAETLVAYQMNWKGENFYTGNHIPAYVSSGTPFTTWLKKKRDEGAKVMYFVTEHNRVSGLKNEVAGKSYKEITDKALCNKFVVVRAEL